MSVTIPFFNENGTIILVSEDDQSKEPNLCVFDINKFLADPTNTLLSDEND